LTLEQLFPERRSVELADTYRDLRLGDAAPPARPYVAANMVMSADGRAALGGHTQPISSEVDRALFLELRTQVDAVMVGTATIGIEGYGPLVKSDERKERRRAAGLEPVPLAVTATRTLELPVDAPLFRDRHSRIAVLTNSERPPPPCEAELIVERIEGEELDLAAGMTLLRETHRARSVLLEGGPTLLGAMTAAGVVDELFLTISPRLVGAGGDPSLIEGPPLEPGALGLELMTVFAAEGALFLRYRFER
jgi:riboflavin-specific deaminase-like protein